MRYERGYFFEIERDYAVLNMENYVLFIHLYVTNGLNRVFLVTPGAFIEISFACAHILRVHLCKMCICTSVGVMHTCPIIIKRLATMAGG